jgi:mannosyl-oligosaccharide alpha-1,2-mannosidase
MRQTLLTLLALVPNSFVAAHPKPDNGQVLPPVQPYKAYPDRAAGVREAFRHAWKGYYKYAFPHDELHPLSNGFGDSRYVHSAYHLPIALI